MSSPETLSSPELTDGTTGGCQTRHPSADALGHSRPGEGHRPVTRRQALAAGAVVAGAVWSAPLVEGVLPSAGATSAIAPLVVIDHVLVVFESTANPPNPTRPFALAYLPDGTSSAPSTSDLFALSNYGLSGIGSGTPGEVPVTVTATPAAATATLVTVTLGTGAAYLVLNGLAFFSNGTNGFGAENGSGTAVTFTVP